MAMKPGNLSQTVWRRSVGKQFHDQKRGGVSDLTREGRYSSLAMPAGGYAVWADSVKEGSSGRIGYYAVLEAAGNVAAAGAVRLPYRLRSSSLRAQKKRRSENLRRGSGQPVMR